MTKKEAKGIINKVKYEYTFNCNKNSLKVIKAFNMAIEALSIDIIRCKNCRYWYRKINKCNRCPSISGNWEANDFCSHGKRRIDSEEIK